MTSEKPYPILLYGKADAVQSHLGITDKTAYYISGIVVFAGVIEFHLERFIWRLNGLDPKGQRPNTDGKPVTAWITTLKDYAEGLPESAGRDLSQTWCRAAEFAAKIVTMTTLKLPVSAFTETGTEETSADDSARLTVPGKVIAGAFDVEGVDGIRSSQIRSVTWSSARFETDREEK